ncbi:MULTISPECIES: hypothetical protein [Alkalihalophilus]|jgi:hypothetical protein|uniref:Uncharacterized protein n=3 Tax=Alkalihalophilus TaxID=2893060 RepID=D3FVX9_ALKPO|nr:MULTISPECIES: hypothetical protein [Alkalihalophilus]ADC50411.1 hypothetical protein BpOF4_11790 [Alkalihalophilus pseudofirmus OF4]ERN55011.1 hypothetical protein A33I_03475 [Alkalihalophilus marmarensis DSM 21297]MCM3489351.1 hypothetical protein [Alkalihalophilus marmarensis]MDV2883561.1 hypothetical protein [Alkalihalophilus pseudofirmus]MEC2072133.1 hypothetical protein [Alkalihalophilus marmarensis]
MKKALATQRCIEISQEIGWTEKRIVETSYDMFLFEDKLTVKDDHYPIQSIFDISYRKKPEKDAMGFLYLHTNRGVRTYYIKEEPIALINAYRQLIQP